MKIVSGSNNLTFPATNPTIQLNSLSSKLRNAAWILWLLSLTLPSFVVSTRVGASPGLLTLIMGLLFGWAVFGWAAYANLFFLYAATRLSSNRESPAAILAMLLLAATIFGFKGVIQDEGSGTILPVVSWGWGALLWGCSIVLLTLAFLVNGGGIRKQGVVIALAILTVTAIGLGLLGLTQRRHSNLQEKEMYFPWGIVFTTADLSNLPFSWPDSAVVPRNELVAFEIDDVLQEQERVSPYLYLPLPTPTVLRQYGADWNIYNYGKKDEIKVRINSSKIKYVLQAKKVEGGASINILEVQSQKNLYEQPLKIKFINSAISRFTPEGQPWTGGTYGVHQSIERALGIEALKRPPTVTIYDANAMELCSPHEKQSYIANISSWDGRDVLLKSEEIKTSVGFCSKNYIALTEVRRFEELGVVDSQVTTVPHWRTIVKLFDRVSLAPVAVFTDGKPWACKNECQAMEKTKVRGVRFTNSGAVVETEDGEVRAEKRYN